MNRSKNRVDPVNCRQRSQKSCTRYGKAKEHQGQWWSLLNNCHRVFLGFRPNGKYYTQATGSSQRRLRRARLRRPRLCSSPLASHPGSHPLSAHCFFIRCTPGACAVSGRPTVQYIACSTLRSHALAPSRDRACTPKDEPEVAQTCAITALNGAQRSGIIHFCHRGTQECVQPQAVPAQQRAGAPAPACGPRAP